MRSHAAMASLLGLTLVGVVAACDPASGRGPVSPHPHAQRTNGRPGKAVPAIAAPPAAMPVAPRVPTASRRQLASGATIAIVEDRDAPRVALRMSIAAGTASDTERAGASIVAAHALAMTIEDRAAALGARVEVDVAPDATTFAIDVAPGAVGPAIELLADLAKAAAPSAPLVARATRRAALEAKRLAAEDDEHAAAFVIIRDAYDLPTARHPYGTASATAAEIAEVTASDVRTITTARYVAAAVTLVAVGDVAAADAMTIAERALAATSPKPLPRLDLTEPFARDHDRVTLVDRPGAQAAHVLVGIPAPSPAAGSPVGGTGIAAIEVALEIVARRLGGDARAKLYAFDDGPQIARIDLSANPRRAAAEVVRVESEIESIARDAPTEAETADAKRRLLGGAARALASSDGVADLLAEQGANGGSVERRLGALATTTPQVVSIAAQALAHAKLHVVVVGDAKIAAQDLTAIAEVKVVDPLADYARLRSVQAAR